MIKGGQKTYNIFIETALMRFHGSAPTGAGVKTMKMKLAEAKYLPETDQKKVNAILALAQPHLIADQFTVIFYSADSIQVEWRNKSGLLIWRDFTFARDFIAGFQQAIKSHVSY